MRITRNQLRRLIKEELLREVMGISDPSIRSRIRMDTGATSWSEAAPQLEHAAEALTGVDFGTVKAAFTNPMAPAKRASEISKALEPLWWTILSVLLPVKLVHWVPKFVRWLGTHFKISSGIVEPIVVSMTNEARAWEAWRGSVKKTSPKIQDTIKRSRDWRLLQRETAGVQHVIKNTKSLSPKDAFKQIDGAKGTSPMGRDWTNAEIAELDKILNNMPGLKTATQKGYVKDVPHQAWLQEINAMRKQ